MTTTAMNVAGSSRRKGDYGHVWKKRTFHVIAHGLNCPECGCAMEERTGKHGRFNGCVRFPFCVGTIPDPSNKRKLYDSYTQLLLAAHKAAVSYLSRPTMLGKEGAIKWFLQYPLLMTSTEVLLKVVEAASAEASRLGPPKDFIQTAHDYRIAHAQAIWGAVYTQRVLRQKPKPIFTRRWDNSLVEQIELDLVATEPDNRDSD